MDFIISKLIFVIGKLYNLAFENLTAIGYVHVQFGSSKMNRFHDLINLN